MELTTLLIRFIITFVASFLFGLERQRAHKPVGFGTFSFVSLGACILTIIAQDLGLSESLGLLAGIITGIGFLGAGALIKGTDKVFGFTSAAGIWLFSIFGIAIGLGEYVGGFLIYASLWLIIGFDQYLEKKGRGSYQKKLMITTKKVINEEKIKECFSLNKINNKKVTFEIDKEHNRMVLNYLIEGTRENMNKFAMVLLEKDWISSCKIE